MSLLKVKVCGLTRSIDIKRAVGYGADIVGFIFYRKSKRFVSVKDVKKLSVNIPPTIMKVGVFVEEEVDRIIKVAKLLKLDFVQLSGEETNKQIAAIQKQGFKVIKTFYLKHADDYRAIMKSKADIVQLDNSKDNKIGGTGERFDWKIKSNKRIDNLMLSGGLNANNIEEGIKIFKPLIVDINSGIETKPGVKSDKLMKTIFDKINRLRYGK